eukprot:scaffold49582_cov75-Phaeocystis_antarctica.AAC.6
MAEEREWREGDPLAKPNRYAVDRPSATPRVEVAETARHPRQLQPPPGSAAFSCNPLDLLLVPL